MSTLARTTAIVTIGVLLAGCGDDGNDLAAGGASDGGLAIEVVSRDDGTLPTPAVEPVARDEEPVPDGDHAGEHAGEAAEAAAMDDHDESGTGMHDDADEDHADEGHADEGHADDGDGDEGHADDGDGDEGHADEGHADETADEDRADEGDGDEGHADDGDADEDEADESATAADPADTVASEPIDEGFVVNVEMVEFGYVADQTVLPMGEEVVFRFVNTGVIPHEAMFGSHHQQEEFAAAGDHGDHGDAGHHGEVTAITLDAGGASDLVVRFEEPGEVWIGCHLPGHWDAGMFATFQVA